MHFSTQLSAAKTLFAPEHFRTVYKVHVCHVRTPHPHHEHKHTYRTPTHSHHPCLAHNSHEAALKVGELTERLPAIPVGEHCAGRKRVGGEAVRKRDSKRLLIVVAV